MLRVKRKAPATPEHDIQCQYIKWVRLQYPNALVFAIPNAGKRSPRLGDYMRAEGLVKGVSDVMCLWPSSTHHGLFIEFKSAKGRLTPEQEAFIAYANELSYLAVVCYTFEEAREATVKHLREYSLC